MSGISQSVDGKQVPAVQVIELPLQRLQSEIEILKVNTKDLPQEINDLRNKVLDIEAQLAPAAFSKAFSSTIYDLTTKSKAAIHTKVGKVLESQELRDRVSSQVVKQMESEKTQRVLQDYAKKAVKLADRDVDHPGMLITHKSQHSHTKHVSTGIPDQCSCRGRLELASSNDRLMEPFQAEIPVAAIRGLSHLMSSHS
ncbi:hypothetical protein IG631_12664 [Alternaria alternata]|nr:hypothetical protein IG631_12664 [Alternaria alternata]